MVDVLVNSGYDSRRTFLKKSALMTVLPAIASVLGSTPLPAAMPVHDVVRKRRNIDQIDPSDYVHALTKLSERANNPNDDDNFFYYAGSTTRVRPLASTTATCSYPGIVRSCISLSKHCKRSIRRGPRMLRCLITITRGFRTRVVNVTPAYMKILPPSWVKCGPPLAGKSPIAPNLRSRFHFTPIRKTYST